MNITERRPYTQRTKVVDEMTLRQCCICEKWKKLEKFPPKFSDPNKAHRRQRWCRKCLPLARILRRFNLSYKEYKALPKQCEICGSKKILKGHRNLPIDHDHKTGEKRGVLCHSCNLGIGHFGDDPMKLEAAAAYLRRYAG